jgi:predicted NBD/HSP70 family sugar kinase
VSNLFAGIDYGGTETKAVVCTPDSWSPVVTSTGPDAPGLRQAEPASWPEVIRAWAERSGGLHTWRGLGIALAVPMVHGIATDRTRKLKGLDGQSLAELSGALHAALGIPVSLVHDGVAALLGEFALDPAAVAGSAGMLTFGKSIGFGWARNGEPLSSPYTSWISHMQLSPTRTPAVPCPGCQQVGCWRSIYQEMKGDAENAKADCLPALLEATAQGIATVLNVLPMDRLFLGGGWTRHNLDAAGIDDASITRINPWSLLLEKLRPRLLIPPESVLHFAGGGTWSGAIGAAWQTQREISSVT